MAASATFGRAGSADTTEASLPAVGENASMRVAQTRRAVQSALSSSEISATDALASPKSIAVLAL